MHLLGTCYHAQGTAMKLLTKQSVDTYYHLREIKMSLAIRAGTRQIADGRVPLNSVCLGTRSGSMMLHLLLELLIWRQMELYITSSEGLVRGGCDPGMLGIYKHTRECCRTSRVALLQMAVADLPSRVGGYVLYRRASSLARRPVRRQAGRQGRQMGSGRRKSLLFPRARVASYYSAHNGSFLYIARHSSNTAWTTTKDSWQGALPLQ